MVKPHRMGRPDSGCGGGRSGHEGRELTRITSHHIADGHITSHHITSPTAPNAIAPGAIYTPMMGTAEVAAVVAFPLGPEGIFDQECMPTGRG